MFSLSVCAGQAKYAVRCFSLKATGSMLTSATAPSRRHLTCWHRCPVASALCSTQQPRVLLLCSRPLSTQQPKQTSNAPSQQRQTSDDDESVLLKVIDSSRQSQVAKTTAQKVRQGATDVTYVLLALGAAGCVGLLAYYLGSEMLTPNSPQRVFSRALDTIRQDDNIVNHFGTPISGFGEETRRGRRRHTMHLEYEKDGEKRMRMLFYIKGPLSQGSVNCEVKMDESNHYVFRYLFVETDDRPSRTIVLIDNR